MNFNKINIETWGRREFYLRHMTDTPCTYSMCVNLNISKLVAFIKSKKLKLFPVCLYGITHIVNQHQEFRMALDEQGCVGYFDVSNPRYTIFHKENESFTNIWTEYNEDFNVFYQAYNNDMEQYQSDTQTSKPTIRNNLFNVSCIPWTSFTGFNLNLQNGYNYFPPIFTIGKYFAADANNNSEKMLLPLAIQVHHAVCDGFHTARFVNELQEWMDNFSL